MIRWILTRFGCDLAGRLQGVTNGSYRAAYTYLANAPLVSQITLRSNSVTRMTTTKSYDFLNRLTNIVSSGTGFQPVSFAYAYNSANQRTAVTNTDNARWVYQYDSLGQVVSGKKYWSDGTPVAGQHFEYAFDDIGNRQSTKAGGDNSGANLRPALYLNNSLNQIASREVPSYVNVLGTASNNATVTLWGDNGQYSPTTRKGDYFRGELYANNSTGAVWLTITNVAVLNNGGNPDIVTNAVGRTFVPKTPETFGYDADGNLTNDGRWTLTWDAENRLVRLVAATATGPQQRIDFAYDWQGRRIGKKVWNNPAGTGNPAVDERFVYDGWNVIAVLNAQSSILKSFMWGLDLSGTQQGAGGVGGLVKVYDQSANKHYFPGYDGNGNVVLLVNGDTGEEAARYEYGPFGETIRMTGPVAKANPFRFSTKFQDDETDLLYYGHRYYNPSTGRWPSRDPFREVGFETVRFASLKPRLLALALSSDMQNADTNLMVLFDWSAVLQAAGNPYGFLRNAPISRWDFLGMFGDGDAKFKGHKDFSNLSECPFDYTLEDKGSTSPFKDPERHFRPLGRSASDVQAAIKSCSRDAFQRGMHRGQDYFSHYAKGYVWDPGNVFQKCAGYGHACDGTKPDEDMNAWAAADKWTQGMLKKWKDACCGCGK